MIVGKTGTELLIANMLIVAGVRNAGHVRGCPREISVWRDRSVAVLKAALAAVESHDRLRIIQT